MRVLIVSKILGLAAYRRKLDEIAAASDIDRLVAVVPPAWREPGGRTIPFETSDGTPHYELRLEPLRFNGSYHLFYWPTLRRVLHEVRPDVVHLDEEPYNLATFLGALHARRVDARFVFFTWQNLLRRYPPPFRAFERYVYNRSAHAIAGNQEALDVMRCKGYRGPASVIPQFGVDPELFAPASRGAREVPTIGFVARLVEEKGLLVLLDALAGVSGNWRLHVIGTGPLLSRARRHAEALGLGPRIGWEPGVASTQMAQRLRSFDIVVQPSLTRRNWKEQFGRVLMEAMACGVAVIGSDSGEIPHLVGDAGLIVPENSPDALRAALARLLQNAELRAELGRLGRARVLDRFTHQRIAADTVGVYRSMLGLGARQARAMHSIPG